MTSLAHGQDLAGLLARSVRRIQFHTLPASVVDVARRGFIDTVGVALAGSREPCVDKVAAGRLLAPDTASAETVSVIGRTARALPDHAALINGTAAHALDFDDTGASSQGHPSAVLVPALLALAEARHLPGWRVIEAYVVGVEVLSRLSRGCPRLHTKGVHPTSALGVIAVSAACARLLGLTPRQTQAALGISASMSSGVFANFGSMSKPLHAGLAASQGLSSALLAARGFTASEGALDGPHGLLQLYGANLQALPSLFADFGGHFALLDPGMHVKRHPSCALSHRLVDIALDLRERHRPAPGDIVAIRCRATPRAVHMLRFGEPTEPLQGKFSAPFLVATALIHGRIAPDSFRHAALADSTVRRLMALTDFRVHEDWQEPRDEWRGDRIELELADGRLLAGECVYPKGHAKNPLSRELLECKFLDCARAVLPPDHAAKLLRTLEGLEDLENVGLLNAALAKGLPTHAAACAANDQRHAEVSTESATP